MTITLLNSNNRIFAVACSWEMANRLAKKFFIKNLGSDLYYAIDLGAEQAAGSIDLEPRSFHEGHKDSIITTHLATWWGNIAKLTKPTFGIETEFVEQCKRLLSYL